MLTFSKVEQVSSHPHFFFYFSIVLSLFLAHPQEKHGLHLAGTQHTSTNEQTQAPQELF